MRFVALLREMDRGRLGLLLVAGGGVWLAVTFGASAATAPSHSVTDGNERRTLVGIQGGGVGLHDHGSVQLLDAQDRRVWSVDGTDSYFDVTRLDDGSVLAGFMDSGYEACRPYQPPCTRTGFRILDPRASDPVVDEYSFPVRTGKNSEVHDVERLPSGEFLLADMERERIYTVRPNGTVSWQWNASSLYEPPADPTRVDWLHVNDVDHLGSNRYLVSVRNANQLVVVERGEGVVEIVNRDRDDGDDDSCTKFDTQLRGEDPRCGDPTVMDHQHNPQWLSEDAILVADSGNDRVVELHREGDKWTVAWVLHEANGVEFSWPRDADRLRNGNTLVTDSGNARLVEVNKSGTVVWSTTMDYIPYEADRLPEGETVGAETYDATGSAVRSRGNVPVLSPLLAAARTAYPLPFWLTEWHLPAALVGLVFTLGGGALWAVEWLRDWRGSVAEGS